MPKISNAQAFLLSIESISSRKLYKSIYVNSQSIHLSAVFSATHYGYFSDLIQGPMNTSVIDKSSRGISSNLRVPSPTRVDDGPVSCQFITNEIIVDGATTQSLNIHPRSRIFSPYIDGEIPNEAMDREDYILQNGIISS